MWRALRTGDSPPSDIALNKIPAKRFSGSYQQMWLDFLGNLRRVPTTEKHKIVGWVEFGKFSRSR